MSVTIREAFERGTDTFNAHDLDGFAKVIARDVRFTARGPGCTARERRRAGDVPPTGRAVSVPYIHTLRYREGLNVSFNLLFDRLLMLEQLGLVPAAAAA